MAHHVIFDVEIIGQKWPVFLTCATVVETGEAWAFWGHSLEDMRDLLRLVHTQGLTFVGFNSNDFDYPMVCAAVDGWDERELKRLATTIIDEELPHWITMERFRIPDINFDRIDLFNVAPGVDVSLKRYMGRMGYPTLVDMPFHHDTDLRTDQLPIVKRYCFNDCGGTEALFKKLKEQIALRERMSEEYGIDLRSKSDAQIAEAVLKKRLGLKGKQTRPVPRFITYTAPDFIQTSNRRLRELIERMENQRFLINQGNGSPEAPDWMTPEFPLGTGAYQVGIGGLHSTHDVKVHLVASDTYCLSDFDVASYYPNIIMKAGLVPQMGGDLGDRFLEVYRHIYEERIAAKRSGDTVVANSLKISLNGTYGKLGSKFSAFYSPDLMLAVCLTGQLNLLILIDQLESIPAVNVHSANTDGILVGFPPSKRDAVQKVFDDNSGLTGFEYEETPYSQVAFKDVNNYIAVGTNGKVKGKGLYADMNLMKNPSMQVCTSAAIKYLTEKITPEEFIPTQTDILDFLAVREVKGGGVQYERMEWVDDWELIEDLGTAKNVWFSKLLD